MFSTRLFVCVGILCAGTSLTADPKSDQEFIDLKGTWKIRFEDQPEYKEANLTDDSWEQTFAPAVWKGLTNGEVVAWYRKRFELPVGSNRVGLAMTFVGHDADETFVNGRRIGQTASMDDSKIHAYGQIRVYPIPQEFLKEGSNLVAIRLRGYLPQNSGINQGRMGIGLLADLEKRRAGIEVRQFSFAAAYIVVGLYFFILFLRVPFLRTHLFFSLFGLSLGCYILLRTQGLQETMGFHSAKRMEYTLLYAMPIFFAGFWHEFHRWPLWITGTMTVLFAAFLPVPIVFDSPGKWNSFLAFWHPVVAFFSLLTIAALIRKGAQGDRQARIMLFGTVIFVLTIINDALDDRALLQTIRLSEYGFLAFVVSMSASLVETFVVLQRAQAETLARLTAMDQLKERLLVNVTNILNEPVGLIKANVLRLRGTAGRDASVAGELLQQGQAMNDALDGVLLLSRLQSGVETSSLRVMKAAELSDVAPLVDWAPGTSVLASSSTLGVFLQNVARGGRLTSTSSGGIRIELCAPEAGRVGELHEALVLEAVRVLGGRLDALSSGVRVVEIPSAAAPAHPPRTGGF